MQKKNTRIKIILFIGIVVLLAILFVPFDHTYVSDGGSHGCRAIAYSVWYQHSFSDSPFGRDESTGMMYTSYITGWTVDIFGIEVYSERHEEKEYTISISEHDAIKQSVNAS